MKAALRKGDDTTNLNEEYTDEQIGEVKALNYRQFFDLKANLVSYREKNKLDLGAMADFLDCTEKDLERFEQYDSDPTISEMQDYALALMLKLDLEIPERPIPENANQMVRLKPTNNRTSTKP